MARSISGRYFPTHVNDERGTPLSIPTSDNKEVSRERYRRVGFTPGAAFLLGRAEGRCLKTTIWRASSGITAIASMLSFPRKRESSVV